jgi:hypothetical protein
MDRGNGVPYLRMAAVALLISPLHVLGRPASYYLCSQESLRGMVRVRRLRPSGRGAFYVSRDPVRVRYGRVSPLLSLWSAAGRTTPIILRFPVPRSIYIQGRVR